MFPRQFTNDPSVVERLRVAPPPGGLVRQRLRREVLCGSPGVAAQGVEGPVRMRRRREALCGSASAGRSCAGAPVWQPRVRRKALCGSPCAGAPPPEGPCGCAAAGRPLGVRRRRKASWGCAAAGRRCAGGGSPGVGALPPGGVVWERFRDLCVALCGRRCAGAAVWQPLWGRPYAGRLVWERRRRVVLWRFIRLGRRGPSRPGSAGAVRGPRRGRQSCAPQHRRCCSGIRS